MRLHLIRHGQTEANEALIMDTRYPGANLTELGRKQAAGIPARLAGEPITSLSMSNLPRTHQTIAPLAAALGIEPVERPGLAEIDAGAWDGTSIPETGFKYLEVVGQWVSGDMDVRLAGGTTGREVKARFDHEIAAIEKTGAEVAALVAHGAVIPFWVMVTTGTPSIDYFREHRLMNTDIITVEGTLESGYRLVMWAGEPYIGE
ncbi:putative phosphoglycerate mutase [Arcanobacterium wilhelmae]|uniref:Phosphoglycerate mutase n=1 Tax=Arcanobacterium wilhelmae TaxID=1803177 RepID=A0ABT9N916_9ACTO|nr:histidine phosphatase family protein [Arcanobacterium wilhelmae]MDP9800192.1 putative phosphoglycerate mutase [Arcanobacterium wilhelmae]WFN89633.1 histidine phosphatase family protein [Arcanobacterium wilhelmae]